MLCDGQFQIDLPLTALKQVRSSVESLKKLTFGAAPLPSPEEMQAQASKIVESYESDPEAMKAIGEIRLIVEPDRVRTERGGESTEWKVLSRSAENEIRFHFKIDRGVHGEGEWLVIANDTHILFACPDSVAEYVWKRVDE